MVRVMKFKKEKKAQQEGAIKTEGTSIARLGLPWLGGLLVLLVAGLAVIAQLLLVVAPKEDRQQLADRAVLQQAALINITLDNHQRLARQLAADQRVNQILEFGDSSELSAQLSALYAPAKVLLVNYKDSALRESLSYLDRDSITKSAASGEEVVLTEGKDVALVMAIKSANGAGAVLIHQPLDALWRQVRQTVGSGDALQVGPAGQYLRVGQAPADAVQASAKLNLGSSVSVWLPPRGSSMQQPIFLVLSLIVVVLVLLIAWLFTRQLDATLRRDVDQLCKILRQGSKKSVEVPPRLDLMHALMLRLAGQPLATNIASPAKAKAAKPVVVEEDETSVTPAANMIVEDAEPEALPLGGNDDTPSYTLPEEIFRAYDIRGKVGDTLTEDGVRLIGRAIGSAAMDAGQQTVLVARDGRLSGPKLSEALIKGLLESGRDVVDLGDVPTPVLYYATHVLDSNTGVCVTGSHNPSDYNGIKIVMNGEAMFGDQIAALRQRILDGKFSKGGGKLSTRDISERYLNDILQDIVLAKSMKVVIDCGNGIAGKLAPDLFRNLGCEVVELYCEVDGNFPNHHPDPSKEANLADLIQAVADHEADLGVAFDGDGDRLGVVTKRGHVIWPDRLMMLFAKDLLNRSPGADIIFDVKCSRALPALIRRQGGRPLMWKTGHSYIKAKLKETGAPLAGEMSGHIFFADRWFGVDDGMYAAARLLEILSVSAADSDGVFSNLKTGIATPELSIPSTEADKFRLIEQLCAKAVEFVGGSPTTLDGLRMDYPDGWGLVRASNTTPILVARFEGKDEAALERIKMQFRKQLLAIEPKLELPF